MEGCRGRELRSPLGDGIVHGLEPQPCGVQVVEWLGLVASRFPQFFTRLAAVFAEEVGDFCGVVLVVWMSSPI